MKSLNFKDTKYLLFKSIVTGYKKVIGCKKSIIDKLKLVKGDKFKLVEQKKFITCLVTCIKHYKNLDDYLDNNNNAIPNAKNPKNVYLSFGVKPNEPFCSVGIEPIAQNVFTYWHGSTHQLKKLEPRKSNLANKPVVFATIDRMVAASFIPKWSDDDFCHGRRKKKWRLVARHNEAIELLKVPGYIHRIDNNEPFYRNEKLGLLEEYICEQEVKVTNVEKIPDVYEYIKDYFIITNGKQWNDNVSQKGTIQIFSIPNKEFEKSKSTFKEMAPHIFEESSPVIMQGDKVLEGHHAIAAAQFLNSTVRVCKLRPKYKKIKLLGRGWWGETHLVEEDGVKYALKTERILSKESIQGELDFYSFIDSLAENDQKYFTKLHSYAIYKGQLSFTPPENIKKRKDALTRHKLLKRAGLYCEWLMEYAGDSVLNVKNKITVVRQTLKAAYILRKNGYSHGDIHTANMCFTKNLKLIDYGGIGATTERRKKMFETNHDLTRIINYSLNSRGFFDSIGNVRYKVKDYIDHFKKNDKWMILGTIIKKHGKSEKTNSAIDRITKGSGTSDDYFLANNCFLYGAIYFPEEKHEFFKTLIPDLPFITTLIDRKHIIFMVDNFRNTEKIIKYFNKL